MKNRILKSFWVPLNNPPSLKTAQPLLARGHTGGGGGEATLGTRSWDPGPAKRSFDPPPRGTQVPGGGGTGVKFQKKLLGVLK